MAADEIQTVELKVKMACAGCSGAVSKVLKNMDDVQSFEIEMDKQKVTVIGKVKHDAVLAAVKKTGKVASFWEDEAAPERGGLEATVGEPKVSLKV